MQRAGGVSGDAVDSLLFATGMPLNVRQQKFVAGMVAHGNAAKAYREAYGRKGHVAEAAGSRLLRVVEVQQAIDLLRKPVIERVVEETAIDKAWVIRKLAENAEKASQAQPVLNGKGEPTGEYRYYPSAVNRAFELIGKAQGVFVERVQLSLADLESMTRDELIQVEQGTVPARFRLVRGS